MTSKTTRALHAERPAFDPLVELCEDAVGIDGLHLAAHYRRGIRSFSVSALDELGPDARMLDVPDPQLVLEQIGQRLNFLYTRINTALGSLQSGQLIRMVLLFQRGAVFYYQIRPGEYLVGSRLAGDSRELDAADARGATLVEAIRACLGLGSLNPGGFATALVSREVDVRGDPAPRHEGDAVSDPDAVALCRDAIDLDDLHYVAYFRDQVLLFSLDLLDHDSLAIFHQTTTPEARRRGYGEIGRFMHRLTQQMNSSLLAPLEGQLVQLVTDVEEGAAYYLHLTPGSYVVGVTLDQTRVAVADAVVRELAESLRSLRPADPETDEDAPDSR